MTVELLWTVFFVLIALVVLAAVVRAIKRLFERQREGGAPHRRFHDH